MPNWRERVGRVPIYIHDFTSEGPIPTHGFNLDRLDLHDAVAEAARDKAEGTSFRWIHLPLNDIDFAEACVRELLGESKHRYQEYQQDFSLFLPYLNVEHFENVFRKMSDSDAPTGDAEKDRTYYNGSEWEILKTFDPAEPQTTHGRKPLGLYSDPVANNIQRNAGQTLLKWTGNPDRMPFDGWSRPKPDSRLLMVDQAWIWVFGEDTLVSCFPYHDVQPLGSYDDALMAFLDGFLSFQDGLTEGQREDTLHRLRDLECEVYEAFEPSSIDIMSSSMVIGKLRLCKNPVDLASYLATYSIVAFSTGTGSDVTDILSIYQWAAKYQASRYADKLHDFYAREASGELQEVPNKESKELLLIFEVMRMQDDLGMLQSLLETQGRIVASIRQSFSELGPIRDTEFLPDELDADLLLDRAQRGFESWWRGVEQLSRKTSQTHSALLNLLDLDQKTASLREARASTKQGQAVMLFTVVTIIFVRQATKPPYLASLCR
ncbi:ankyrin repeat protein [Colletotrichum sojae]|uniref:Ankyrin repeat protein n=1 Tax=Colletotrichum sojae TaxID=2175907 RepID=A0A8H6J817_9PEZI|nr:ankyrin repeat protein [Colletotrichum sojae]